VRRAVALAAVLLAATVVADEKSIFPLEDGARFVYRESHSGRDWGPHLCGPEWESKDPLEVTFHVTGTAKKPGEEARVDVAYGERTAIELRYRVTTDGVALVSKKVTASGAVPEELVRAPELFLKLPLVRGATWKYGPFDATVGDDEDVTVPAGKFRATRVDFKLGKSVPRPICNIMGMAETITMWLAPGTGIVKQTWTHVTPVVPASGPPTSTRELVKVETK
jgi:hypothetical protein